MLRELGLDRHPELRDAYFGHYRRVVWLAQRADPGDARRGRARGRRTSGCRSRCVEVGEAPLERGLAELLDN